LSCAMVSNIGARRAGPSLSKQHTHQVDARHTCIRLESFCEGTRAIGADFVVLCDGEQGA